MFLSPSILTPNELHTNSELHVFNLLSPCFHPPPPSSSRLLPPSPLSPPLFLRLRSIPKSTLMVESYVAKSVTLGGNPQMTREVLSHELESELSTTSKLLFLHNVDHELHAAYSSTEDYFETEVLHG